MRDATVTLRIVDTSWAFETWTPDRLLYLLLRVPHEKDPLTGRMSIRPSVGYSTPQQREHLNDTPTGVRWAHDLAREWERLLWGIERWERPTPLHLVEGTGLVRLESLARLGSVAFRGRETRVRYA